MSDLFQAVLAAGQCGPLALFIFLVLVYQTLQKGKLETLREADRRQIIADAEARTRTAQAFGEAQHQMVLLLKETREGA